MSGEYGGHTEDHPAGAGQQNAGTQGISRQSGKATSMVTTSCNLNVANMQIKDLKRII